MTIKHNTNQFGEFGRAFYDSINNEINKPYHNNQSLADMDFRPILSKWLNLLEFPEAVNIHCANKSGDTPWFYFCSDMDKDFREEYSRYGYDTLLDSESYKKYVHSHYVADKFIRRVVVPHSIEGYWQLLLLKNASYVLAKVWHTCDGRRDCIFSFKDLANIKDSLRNPLDFIPTMLFETYDILPSVELTEDGAIINYCYWEDLGMVRLFRETVKIEVSAANGIHCDILNEELLFIDDSHLPF